MKSGCVATGTFNLSTGWRWVLASCLVAVCPGKPTTKQYEWETVWSSGPVLLSYWKEKWLCACIETLGLTQPTTPFWQKGLCQSIRHTNPQARGSAIRYATEAFRLERLGQYLRHWSLPTVPAEPMDRPLQPSSTRGSDSFPEGDSISIENASAASGRRGCIGRHATEIFVTKDCANRYATADFRHEFCAGRHTTAFQRERQESFPLGTSSRLSERRSCTVRRRCRFPAWKVLTVDAPLQIFGMRVCATT